MAITYTRNDIISRAMRLTGRYAAGEPLPADIINDAALTLNLMLKEWQSFGWYLWLEEEATLFFAKGTNEYTIGSAASDDHATLSHVKTELASAYSAAVASIYVDSTSGMTAGDNIGIEESGNVLQWTTIGSVDTASHLTLTSALANSAAVDAHVYAYTTKMQRPLKIRNSRLKYEDGNEVTVTKIDRDEFFDLSDKTTSGKVVNVYFNPKKNSAKLYTWPVPNDVGDRLFFTARMPLTSFATASQVADFPEEWYDAVTWSLAAEVSWEYGLDMQKIAAIEAKAMGKRQMLKAYDQDDAPMKLVYDGDMG